MTGDIAATISKAREHSIGDLLRRSAGREPNKLAVSCGDVSWTFAEMDAICNRLGRGLLGLGVSKGDRVAVLSRNSHAFAALRFALARIGAVLVPINFMLNPDEINFILKSSGAKLLATGPDFVEPAKAASARDCAVEKMIWLPGEDPAIGARGPHHFRRSPQPRRVVPGGLRRQPRSRPDRLHQRHGIAAQGRDADP